MPKRVILRIYFRIINRLALWILRRTEGWRCITCSTHGRVASDARVTNRDYWEAIQRQHDSMNLGGPKCDLYSSVRNEG
jgi:hypothetical protein